MKKIPMISFQDPNQANTQEQGMETLEESIYSKYEPVIVATSIILVTALIFILIKNALRGFLIKRKEK